MKKLLSILLVFVILLSMVPSMASADATFDSDREKTLAMACELFPEHAYTIRNGGKNIQTFRSTGEPAVLVLTETRQYSEDITLTYTEYSDGSAYVASFWQHTTDTVSSDVSASGNLIKYTVDLTVYTNYAPGKFKVKNIVFCIDSLWNDNIVSAGYVTSDSVSGELEEMTEWEDAENDVKAFMRYSATFPRSGATAFEPDFYFYVYDNKCQFSTIPL